MKAFNRNEFIMEWVNEFQQPEGFEHQLVMDVDGKEITLTCLYYAYRKKEDFIFSLINDQKVSDDVLSDIYDNMDWDTRADYDYEMVEVSWSFNAYVLATDLPMKHRVFILRTLIPYLRKFLKEGYGGVTPQNDILAVAKPQGLKDPNNWTGESSSVGQRQRAALARLVGFGDLKDCGWMFAKYDGEGKLHPA